MTKRQWSKNFRCVTPEQYQQWRVMYLIAPANLRGEEGKAFCMDSRQEFCDTMAAEGRCIRDDLERLLILRARNKARVLAEDR